MNLYNILKLFGSYKKLTTLSIVCNILFAIFNVLTIPYLKLFIDVLFGSTKEVTELKEFAFSGEYFTNVSNYYLFYYKTELGQINFLMVICFMMVSIFFFKNLFKYLAHFFISPVRSGIVQDLRNLLFQKILKLPISYFSEQRKGGLISKMSSDVKEIEHSVVYLVDSFFKHPLTIILTATYLIAMNPKLTIYVVILLGFSGLITGIILKPLRSSSHKLQNQIGRLMSIFEETLGGLKIVKGFNAHSYVSTTFREQNDKYQKMEYSLYRRQGLASPMSEFVGISVVAILLFIGAKDVFEGKMEASDFITYLYAFYAITEPIKELTKGYSSLQKGLGAVSSMNEILEADISIRNVANPQPVKFEDEISFQKINFNYSQSDNQVLNDISLTIKKGDIIAFVGNSGAGKSTLVDLVPRFHDITSGKITFDGIDIKEIELQELRSLFGIVTQDPILFNDTIYNNILFGAEGYTKEDVEQAAKIANAHDFILETENGYDTNIGDRGMKLSGGQRQRLTIARAILKNPPILILDEATSALDSKSEKFVQEALERVMKNRTALIVAHRLSTIRNANQIVVMKDGEIIDKGDHKSLMLTNDDYKSMVNLQTYT